MSLTNLTAFVSTTNQTLIANTNDIFVGLIIFIPSLICFLLYIPVVLTFAQNPIFNKNSCYQLMLSLSISDGLNLIGWLVIGSYIFLHGDVYNDTCFTAVLVANFGGWRNLSWHQATLALNRYVATCRRQNYDALFSPLRIRILVAVAWIHSIVWASLAFIEPHITFHVDGYFEDFPNAVMQKFYLIEDTICSALCLLVCTWSYGKIFLKYRETTRLVRDVGRECEMRSSNDDKNSTKQFRLAFQLFFGSAIYASNAIGFYLVTGVEMNEWLAFFISTYTGVLNNGVSVIIYLVFNVELRAEIRRKWFPWKISCVNTNDEAMRLNNFHAQASHQGASKIITSVTNYPLTIVI